MANKDHDGPDSRQLEDVPSVDGDAERVTDSQPIDLKSEAIAHLIIACKQFETQARALIQNDDVKDRQPIIEDLMRIRNTLVVLEKPATQFVIEELLAALHEYSGMESKTGELARVLHSAVRHLGKHLRQMQNDVDIDNALALVPLVNDCRAYRDEMLLSDVLMLAVGIDLPKPPLVSVSETRWSEQRSVWVDYASSNHMSLVQRLLHWWREERAASVGPLIRQLDRFVTLSESHGYLNGLTPLFQAASLVAAAVKDKQLDDGPAIRSLFAQMERNVHRSALVAAPDDLVPSDLLRNFLYYVAQIDSESDTAIALRRRFRLDKVRQIAQSAIFNNTPTIGVEYHLTNAIRDGVARETESLRAWLDEPDTHYVHSKLVRLRVRLGQLEPALTIMGAITSLECLVSINHQLNALRKDHIADESTCLELAQSLAQLDALLDQSARQSILQSRGEKSARVSVRDIYIDIATDSCLREARNELQELADQLIPMIVARSVNERAGKQIAGRLNTVNSVLQILPLPELSPLLGSLASVVHHLTANPELLERQTGQSEVVQKHTESESLQVKFANLLASLDDYLGCVLLPQPAASQFLTNASETLDQITEALGISGDAGIQEPDEDLFSEDIGPLLGALDSIGQAIASCRSISDDANIKELNNSLVRLQQLTDTDAIPAGLRRLASSTHVWFKQIVAQGNKGLSENNLLLLEEVQGFLPMLLSSTEQEASEILGLDELVRQLETEAMDAPDDVFVASEPLLDDLSLPDIGSLTLNVDDYLLLESVEGQESANLDGTLQLVFQHECLGHLESLDESVRLALKPNGNIEAHLPNEQMLRALHTLTGSAQTIDATEVIAIVLPLQRASLSLHREGRHFDAGQTRYIGELVVALRSRLDAISSGEPVGDAVEIIEKKLGAFLSATVPGVGDALQDSAVALSIGSQISSLEDVFSEEASEILDKLRAVIRGRAFDQTSLSASLSLLHTLKGSARMVGKLSISECAHELESRLQSTASAEDQLDALKDGYRSLHGYLLQSTARRMTMAPGPVDTDKNSSHVAVRRARKNIEIDADSLLNLANDLNVNHARLSKELGRLQGVSQDFDSTSFRWRNLVEQGELSDSPAIAEMLADMEAVRLVLRNSLRQAEREQQHAARISANLQESLVRSRLCRLDELSGRLSDTISDIARVCGVAVKFELLGGDIMIDSDLFKQLSAPLEHLARNSVIHGIEPAEQRFASDKPSTGKIILRAFFDGAELVLEFSDDGRGINYESLNAILQAQGKDKIDSDAHLQETLFTAGFSSVSVADSMAGHGLGLSAVQATVEQMKGRIGLKASEGAGVQVTLRIPQDTVVKQVVLVRDDGRFYGIPVVHVKSVQLAEQVSVNNSAESLDDKYVFSVLQLLGELKRNSTAVARQASVLVTVHDQSFQIEVDEIIGYREIVTQPLGAQLDSLSRFSDGSVLPAGQQVLILNLAALLKTAPDIKQSSAGTSAELYSPTALIVDDSHTTRRIARQILQQRGIQVRSSKDGLDALESIAALMPDIMIVDLEMPRLDGFGLLRRLAQLQVETLPAIIVVSHHDSKQNRQTAIELGAVQFLVKPYSAPQLHEAVEAAGLRLPDLTIA